jgi:exosortase
LSQNPSLRIGLTVALLVVLWGIVCRSLSSEWSINEQYNYGWFVPFFAAYLFWLRWEDRPEKVDRGNATRVRGDFALAIIILSLALLLPLRLFEVANPDWRPLTWLHTFCVVAITLTFIWSAGGTSWLRHFMFPVLFFLVAVPWISLIEGPVVQGLMRTVAAVASEALNLLGIPAQLEGNLIRINAGLVGVNEACSGVRSLQTSLMIGLLFGELKRLSPVRRVVLVLGTLAVALLANFGRASILVWIAARDGVETVDRWHDLAGYSIVAVVFLASMALAWRLGGSRKNGTRHAKRTAVASDEDGRDGARPSSFDNSLLTAPGRLRFPSPLLSCAVLVWLVAIELGVEGWYWMHERVMPPVPGWTVRWPENAPGFRDLRVDQGVKNTLRFDEGREVTWKDSATGAPAERCFLSFFRWNPGGSSVVRARAHRPDICLPSQGWRPLGNGSVRSVEVADGFILPFRRVDFEKENTRGPVFARTFFCLQEDRRTSEARPDLALPPGIQPDWALAARWHAVRDGVRNMGQQVLELVIMSADPGSAKTADADFARMLPALLHIEDEK